jgi:chromosome segregation ATPase
MPHRLISPLLVLIVLVLCACESKETDRLRVENDSLRTELVSKNEMVTVMKDVKGLIDSIDMSRKVLRMDLHEGMKADQVTTRLKDINGYVKSTQDKIKSIESRLKASDKKANGYLMMMDALKSELGIRVQEVASLEAAVEEYKKENDGLVKTVKLQQAEMAEMQSKIEEKQQELAFLDAKVKGMVSEFKVSEADAYYARAKAVEEAANRTRLAPRRKKETYREALELYKKALSLGKKEAQKNITALEKKVK